MWMEYSKIQVFQVNSRISKRTCFPSLYHLPSSIRLIKAQLKNTSITSFLLIIRLLSSQADFCAISPNLWILDNFGQIKTSSSDFCRLSFFYSSLSNIKICTGINGISGRLKKNSFNSINS